MLFFNRKVDSVSNPIEPVLVSENGLLKAGGKTYRIVIRKNGQEVRSLSKEQREQISARAAKILNQSGGADLLTKGENVRLKKSGIESGGKIVERKITFWQWLFGRRDAFARQLEKITKLASSSSIVKKVNVEVLKAVKTPQEMKALIAHKEFIRVNQNHPLPAVDQLSGQVTLSKEQLKIAVSMAAKIFSDLQAMSPQESAELVRLIAAGEAATLKKSNDPACFRILELEGRKQKPVEMDPAPLNLDAGGLLLHQLISNEDYKVKAREAGNLFIKDVLRRGSAFSIFYKGKTIKGVSSVLDSLEGNEEKKKEIKGFVNKFKELYLIELQGSGQKELYYRQFQNSPLWKKLLGDPCETLDSEKFKSFFSEYPNYRDLIADALNLEEGDSTDQELIYAKFFEFMLTNNQGLAATHAQQYSPYMQKGLFTGTIPQHESFYDDKMNNLNYFFTHDGSTEGSNGLEQRMRITSRMHIPDLHGTKKIEIYPFHAILFRWEACLNSKIEGKSTTWLDEMVEIASAK